MVIWGIESHGALRIATTFDLFFGQYRSRRHALGLCCKLLRLVAGSGRFLANQVRLRRGSLWRLLSDLQKQGLQLRVKLRTVS